MNADPVLLYITAANREEALAISRELLSGRLIACANIVENATSLYWWQGQIEHEPETLIIAKTVRERVEAVSARVKALHSYRCPCVVSVKIEGGHAEYLDWIRGETRNGP